MSATKRVTSKSNDLAKKRGSAERPRSTFEAGKNLTRLDQRGVAFADLYRDLERRDGEVVSLMA